MGELRWILLACGVLILVGIYLYSRRSPSVDPLPHRRREPVLDALDTTGDAESSSESPSAEIREHPAARFPDKVLALRLMARSRDGFPGERLILALRQAELRHGRFGIFHRHPDEGSEPDSVMFSVASLVEPGSFDLSALRETNYPGVSFFLALPTKADALTAFDEMLATARQLASELDGELLDEQGSTLSIQRQRFMREEVLQYLHRANGPVKQSG